MTILVNDTLSNTRILCTLTEVDAITTGSTLNIFNPFTNVSSVYALPVDSSLYPDRYNEFIFPTSTFSGLSVGTYDFVIKDSTSATTETGLLKVIRSLSTPAEDVADKYVYITPAEDEDDFIVYQP